MVFALEQGAVDDVALMGRGEAGGRAAAAEIIEAGLQGGGKHEAAKS
jgi:hypothetical protein